MPPLDGDDLTPDLHDAWAAPASTHTTQHFEWLGPCVTQEVAPAPHDQYDDGLGSVVFKAGQPQWQPGSQFTMKVSVSTSHSRHPEYFPAPGVIAVYSYIDWNGDSIFQPSELVDTWVGSPPLDRDADPDTTLYDTSVITVPAGYNSPGSLPAIRLRMTWEQSGQTAPGGADKYGEVEDHFGPREKVEP